MLGQLLGVDRTALRLPTQAPLTGLEDGANLDGTVAAGGTKHVYNSCSSKWKSGLSAAILSDIWRFQWLPGPSFYRFFFTRFFRWFAIATSCRIVDKGLALERGHFWMRQLL